MRLTCSYANGHYPTIKTALSPNGLQFRSGILDVTTEEYEKLKEDDTFAKYLAQGEIAEYAAPKPAPTVESLMLEKNQLSATVQSLTEENNQLKSRIAELEAANKPQ